MKTISVFFTATLSISSAFAGNIAAPKPVIPPVHIMKTTGPVASPTFPEKGKESNISFKNLISDEYTYAKNFYSVEDLSRYDSVKATIEDADGNSYSFIQIKQLDNSYNVFLPKSVYQKLVNQGVELSGKEIHVVSEKEFILLSKQVQLNTFGRLTENDYLGGEGGRCAAGTIGGAITGGLAGAAVGGPAGAVAGAVGGALVGSAASCR